jgi:hypothetical protein
MINTTFEDINISGLFAQQSTMTLINSTFDRCSRGIVVKDYSVMTVENTNFTNLDVRNLITTFSGAGIILEDSNMTMTSSLFDKNIARDGTGIYFRCNPTVV